MSGHLSLWKGQMAPNRPGLVLPTAVREAVIRAVSARTDVTRDEILGFQRSRRIAHARQEVMYELRNQCLPDGTPRYSYPEIARSMGGFDHTTILHGVRAHKARLIVKEAA